MCVRKAHFIPAGLSGASLRLSQSAVSVLVRCDAGRADWPVHALVRQEPIMTLP